MGAPDHRLPGPEGRYLSEPLGPLDVVRTVESSLAGAGFKVGRDSVAGRRAVIAHAAPFGRGPLGSRRHVFVLIAVFKAGMAGRAHLDRFAEEAAQYAATVKGGRGPGAGSVVVAVAVVETVEGPDEADWALVVRERTFPVLVDLAGRRVICPGAPAYQRALAQEHVAATVGAQG